MIQGKCDCTINTGCKEQYKATAIICRQNNGMDWDVPLKPSRLLLEPLQPILEQRGKEYGDYIVMSNKIQAIKSAFGTLAALEPYKREALEMIATKIGRILTGNPDNEDSWRDIAGYATLVADRIPKKPQTRTFMGETIPEGWGPDPNFEDPSKHWVGPQGRSFSGGIVQLNAHLESLKR